MTNIISLDDKLKLTKDKKAALIQKRKILAVKQVFQCSRCEFKCEKCGTQIGSENPDTDIQSRPSSHRTRIPYRFCDSCTAEYLDYIDRLQGKGNPEWYWHNDAWLSVWKNWIDFRSASDNYLKSKEFRRLLQELRQTWPQKPDK